MSAAEQQNTADEVEHATQYLSFRLGKEQYGVRLSMIQEIINYTEVSRVPMTPQWIRGVFNLRGRVLPLIDLAVRFGEEAEPVTKKSCILVLHVDVEGLTVPMGVMSDYVSQVIDLVPSQIEEPPVMGAGLRVDFLQGLYKSENGVVCLLDIPRVFTDEELLAAAVADQRTLNEKLQAKQAIAASANDNDAQQPAENSGASEAPGFHFFEDDEDETGTDS